MRDAAIASLHRANAFVEVDRPEQALKEADRGVRVLTEEPFAWAVKARSHLACGQPAEALEAAEHAVRLGPESQDALRVLAVCLRRLNRPREALAVTDQLLARDPSDHRNHLLAAECAGDLFQQTGRAHRGPAIHAQHALARAVHLHPDSADVHARAGWVYCALDGALMAERSFRRALDIDPLHEQAVQGLLQVSAAKGKVWRSVREGSVLLGSDPRHKHVSRLMHMGYLRAGVRVNLVAALCALPAYVMSTLGLIQVQAPGLLVFRIVVTLLLFGAVAWPTVRLLTPSAAMRRHLSGFRGFRPWMAGLFLMAPAILLLGLLSLPWGLAGLTLLIGAYVLQRVSRRRMREHIEAVERTLR